MNSWMHVINLSPPEGVSHHALPDPSSPDERLTILFQPWETRSGGGGFSSGGFSSVTATRSRILGQFGRELLRRIWRSQDGGRSKEGIDGRQKWWEYPNEICYHLIPCTTIVVVEGPFYHYLQCYHFHYNGCEYPNEIYYHSITCTTMIPLKLFCYAALV